MTKPGTAKQALLLALEHYVYKPATYKLTKQLEEIIQVNALKSDSQAMSFFYKGKLYWTQTNRATGKAGLLDKTLYDTMDKYLQDMEELSKERAEVKGFFTELLLKSQTENDVAALLPECMQGALVHPIPKSSAFSDEYVQAFLASHERSIQLIKERLVLNLVT